MSDPAVTQMGPFLSLPAELRNMIYDLVLITTIDITCQPYQSSSSTGQRLRIDPDGTLTELNQLKFTCRQLYFETHALLPTTPHLVFPKRVDITESASITCARYLNNLSPTALLKFSKLSIMERIPYRARVIWTRIFNLRGISALADFAVQHPNIEINVYLHAIHSDDRHTAVLCQKMEIVNLVVRKRFLRGPRPDSFDCRPSVTKMAGVWGDFAADGPGFAANLKMRTTGVFGVFGGIDEWLVKANRHSAMLIRRLFSDGF